MTGPNDASPPTAAGPAPAETQAELAAWRAAESVANDYHEGDLAPDHPRG